MQNHSSTDRVRNKWKSIKDYVDVLPSQDSIIKKSDTSYLASCPLSHNHKQDDRHQSFIINEVDSNKYKGKIVVYTCLSGCCKQSDLASFFKGRLGYGKN